MAEKDKVLVIGNPPRELDLTKLAPLTMGDRAALAKLGVTFRVADTTPESDIALVGYVLRKVDAAVTDEEVGALPLRVGQAVAEYVAVISAEVEIPFGLRRTPSLGITGGAQPTGSG